MQLTGIAGIQICAARGALKWSVLELSKRTGVGTATIVRYEMTRGVPNASKGNLEAIRSEFESAGIEFTGTPDDTPGIRMHLARFDRRE